MERNRIVVLFLTHDVLISNLPFRIIFDEGDKRIICLAVYLTIQFGFKMDEQLTQLTHSRFMRSFAGIQECIRYNVRVSYYVNELLRRLGDDIENCRTLIRRDESDSCMIIDVIPSRYHGNCHVCGTACRAPTPGQPSYFGADHSGGPYVYVPGTRTIASQASEFADAEPVMVCDSGDCWDNMRETLGYFRCRSTAVRLPIDRFMMFPNAFRRFHIKKYLRRKILRKRIERCNNLQELDADVINLIICAAADTPLNA